MIKIRTAISTALALSFLAIIMTSFGLEFGSYRNWSEPHKMIGWIFIILAALHFAINWKIYSAGIRNLFRKKI